VTTTVAEAVVYFKGDDRQLSTDLDKAEGKTKSWASGVGSIAQGALMGIGMGVVGLVTSATQQAVAFVGDSVGAASDMSETISKVSTVFGDSAAGILAWSETSAQAFGLSKQAALDAAGGLGNMFMQLGAGSKQAGDVSQDMVQLAADLASFHNAAGGTTEVLDTMTAAFRGEYDSVQRFIPTINAAAVELKALEMTGKSNTKELTNLEKALAVQAIMMENAGAAAGDFARTSDGLANQQRILDAQMDNLKATVGEALLPVMLAFTSTLNNIVQAVLPPLTNFIREQVVPVMSSFGDMFGVLRDWFGKFSVSLDTDVSGPLEYWKSWIDTNLPMIQQIFDTVLGAIRGFWALFGDDIMLIVNNTFSNVFLIIDTVMRNIGDLITLALQVLTGDWEGAQATLEGIVTRTWETIGTIISNQIESLKTLFTAIDWAAVGTAIIEGIANGIRNAADFLWEAAQEAARRAYEGAKSWLGIQSPSKKAEEGIGEPFVEGIAQGMKKQFGGLSGAINSGLGAMMSGVQQPTMGAASMNINVYLSGKDATYEAGRAVGRGIQDELRKRGR